MDKAVYKFRSGNMKESLTTGEATKPMIECSLHHPMGTWRIPSEPSLPEKPHCSRFRRRSSSSNCCYENSILNGRYSIPNMDSDKSSDNVRNCNPFLIDKSRRKSQHSFYLTLAVSRLANAYYHTALDFHSCLVSDRAPYFDDNVETKLQMGATS